MSTSIGSAHLDITSDTAKAMATLKAFGTQAASVLKPLTNIDLKVTTTIQKPKTADLRAVLAGVAGSIKVDVVVKPLTQKALNAALAAVKGEKTVKITVDSQDAATRIAAIRTLLTNLGTTIRNLFNINTTGLNAILTAGTAMLAKFATVISDIRALIVQLNAAGGRPTGPPGGSGGGSGINGAYSNQLKLLQADLKAGALSSTQFKDATQALKLTIDAEIASLRGLGVLTADQQKRLDALRISSGQAGAALKGLGGGSAASVAQLSRELDIANSRFQRGDITLREYLREQQRITAAGTALRGSLAAGSSEAKSLEQVFGKLRTATQGINSKSIDQVKTSLAQARAAFDQASTAASTYSQKRDAIIAYQRSVEQLTQRITALGQRSNLTAQQTKTLADLQARLAREQATLQGGTNPLGLGANVLAALRAAFPLVQQVGGSLGAAASGASQFGGSIAAVVAALPPMAKLIAVAVIAVGALAAAMVTAVNKAADFQAVLADIQARTRDADQPVAAFSGTLAKLSAAATTFGQPLGIGAKQAAQGILELSKAGLSAQEILGGGLAGAMNLAGSAGVDLATAAKQAVGAMTAFGLGAKDLPHIADVFSNFAGQTFLDSSDLSLALAAVGPVARDAGLTIEQLAGAMATLAKGGFKNMSDAGTSFKTLLLSLTAPSDTVTAVFKKIGFSAYDAEGKLKPLSVNLDDLRAKLIKLTPEAQKQVLRRIYGTDSIRPGVILLREGAKALDANTAAMAKQGEAARVAKERLDSLRGSQSKLGAAFENLLTKIGLPFLAPLKTMTDAITGVVLALSGGGAAATRTGTAFAQFAAGVKQAVQPLVTIVGGVFQGIAVVWESVLRPVLSFISSTFSVLGQAVFTAVSLVGNIVLAVFTGIGSFLSGVFGPIFGKNMNNIKFSLADVSAAFARWAGTARAYLVAGGKVAGELPPLFQAVGTSIGGVFQGIGKIFQGFGLLAYERLVKPLLPVIGAIRSAFSGVANTIGDVVNGILNFVGTRFAPLVNFLKTVGISIGDALAGVVASAGQSIRALIGQSADGFEAQANAQAEAARQAATGTSQALDLMKDGAAQVTSSVKGVQAATTAFGNSASSTFAQVSVDIAKSDANAKKLQATLSKPYVATVPKALPSGATTLTDLGLGPKGKKTKAAPQTAADVAALDTYKKSLDGLTDAQLQEAKATAISTNNKAHLRAILAEIASRTREGTSEAKRADAQAVRDAATRSALVRELRQAVAVFKLQSDQGKVSAASQLAFNNRIEDFQARIAKLPPELQRGTEALISQAQQLSKNAALHVAAAKKVKDQADSARTLTTQLTQLNDRFRLQTAEGKVTADSLLAYQQRLETLGNQVSKLPAPLQGVLGSLLAQGKGLATAGQGAVAYNTELGKLKVAVKDYTFAELEAARARVVASGGDEKKLALIDAEIKKYKQLTSAQVDQADADSQLAQRSTDTSGLEGQRDNAVAGAKGNLAEIYRLQLEYGTRIQAAQDAQARAQAAKDVLDVNEKYRKLLSLAGITAQQRTILEADQANEVLAINTGLTNSLAKNSSDRLATETDAKRTLDERLRTMDRESRDTIRKDVLDGYQRDTAALEAQQQSELDVEDLTEGQKLAIRQRYQPLLLAQKAKEVQASREIDLQAEADRYADAVDAATRDGTLASQQVKLDEVHRQEQARINRQYDDQERDYSLGVKRDTGKQLISAQKETSAGLLDEAKGHASDILDGIDTAEAAQRESARSTLAYWRVTYAAMGLAGKVAVDEIDAAIRKLDLAGQKARTDAGKLVENDLPGLQGRGASDLSAVGKPDDADSASAKAASQFDSLRDTYQKKLDELRVALGQFADVRDADLTPDQRQVKDGLLGTQQAYQGLLDNVTLAAAQAGEAAATAFTQAQKDAAAEAALSLVEAQKALADVEGKDGSPAYVAGLNAALAYWRARLLGLAEGTPEYLAALQKITDLETKVAASKPTDGLASAFKDASAIVGKATGLSAGVSSALDGLGAYFEAGGSSGGKKSILLGAAALVSGLASVFATGDEDMDRVTNTFVNGVTSVLSKLATGDTIGAIVSGVATVISTIVDIFSGGANSIKKAKENIASATKDVKLFDVSKYAKVVSVGGFFGWLGFKKAEIDQESIDIAKNLGDALYEAISGGMLDGIKAGKASFGELGIDIKKSLSTQILQGLIDGFLKSAVFQATIQPFLDKYIAAMKSGNKEALVAAASDLSGAIDTGNAQLTQFYDTVLVPTSKKLGVYGSDATTDTTATTASSSNLTLGGSSAAIQFGLPSQSLEIKGASDFATGAPIFLEGAQELRTAVAEWRDINAARSGQPRQRTGNTAF